MMHNGLPVLDGALFSLLVPSYLLLFPLLPCHGTEVAGTAPSACRDMGTKGAVPPQAACRQPESHAACCLDDKSWDILSRLQG